MSSQMAKNPQTGKVKLKKDIRKVSTALIPLVEWILSYTKLDAVADLISGVTIGLIIIPQSVAYVAIVGLSAKVGLLSSVVGGIVYTIFGTVKEISVGPTAMMSLLTDQYTSDMITDNIATFCFGCAVVGLILSVLRLGLVVEFISLPVSSAFGSAVALTILASELKNLTGLSYKANKFIECLEKFHSHMTEMKLGDVSLGIICTMILILLDKVKYLPVPKSWKKREILKKAFWLLAMSRNAITLLMACMMTSYFEKIYGNVPYKLSDPVMPGFPEFRTPWADIKINNVTTTFRDRVELLYSGMIITPIVSLLVHVSIAKFFDSGNTIRISHELLSLSISNFLCSFFNSSPVAGAFSRSAVSKVCEVKTPITSFYAAVFAGLALNLVTPYFRLIPRASLSAVIVNAVFSVIDYKIIFPLWKNSRKELFILAFTLFCGLYYGIEIGLIIGVITNLVFLIYLWARPSIEINKCKSEKGDYAIVTPDLGLFYPAVSYLEMQMYKSLKKDPYRNLPIAVNCIFFKGFDYTAIKGLIRIINLYRMEERKIIFFNASSNILNMCAEIDESITSHFCVNEDYFKQLLFSNNYELQTVKEGQGVGTKENSSEANGNCSEVKKILSSNIIRKQNRPNSL